MKLQITNCADLDHLFQLIETCEARLARPTRGLPMPRLDDRVEPSGEV